MLAAEGFDRGAAAAAPAYASLVECEGQRQVVLLGY